MAADSTNDRYCGRVVESGRAASTRGPLVKGRDQESGRYLSMWPRRSPRSRTSVHTIGRFRA